MGLNAEGDSGCGFNPFGQFCDPTYARSVGLPGVTCSTSNGFFHRGEHLTGWFGAKTFSDITDGSSNTIMIGETLLDKGDPHLYWARDPYGGDQNGRGLLSFDSGQAHMGVLVPINYPVTSGDVEGGCGPDNRGLQNWQVNNGFKSNHSGGANFAFADGSVRFIPQSIDHVSYIKLGLRRDGLVVNNQ